MPAALLRGNSRYTRVIRSGASAMDAPNSTQMSPSK
jgi:hypothetical protein